MTTNDNITPEDEVAIEIRTTAEKNANAVIWSELIFVLFPFVVITVIFLYKGNLKDLAYNSEWALGAALLSGQTLVKIVSGAIVSRPKYWARVSLVISGIIVFLFVPSLLVLSLILISESQILWLAVAQIVLFIVSVFAFYAFGGAFQMIQEIS